MQPIGINTTGIYTYTISVNYYIGFAIYKTKNEHKKIIGDGATTVIYNNKYTVLQGTSVLLCNIVEGTHYIILYYLVDNTISNIRFFILTSPTNIDFNT